MLIDNYNNLVSQLLKNWHKGHFGKCNGINFKQLFFKGNSLCRCYGQEINLIIVNFNALIFIML